MWKKFFDDKMKIYLQQNHDETIQLAQQQIISNPDMPQIIALWAGPI